jgi:hypothetical protein
MVLMLHLLSCAQESAAPAPSSDPPRSEPPAAVERLADVQVLHRASLDLRGIRPSVAEVEAVEADPAALDPMILGFMESEPFGERLRDLFSTIYLTRSDYFYVGAADYGQSDEAAFARAVGEEPLRILSTIAEEDLPYTDIVLADWSMVDATIGKAWPTTYPEDGEGWEKVQYTDGRPHAGILSTNGLWWRYMTNESNANRGRANAISRILLCEDYLGKPISFDRSVNLLDQTAVNEAVKSNPGCVACHNTLDPFASYLWGFYYFNYDSRDDTTYYHPEREPYWQGTTGVSPAYYGQPGFDLTDLAAQIAADGRLPQCMVEQSFELLLQRESTLDDTATLTALREDFLGEGLRIKPLLAGVIASDAYRGAPSEDAAITSRKLLSSDQLGTVLEELTGFRFTYQGYDMLQTDTYGLRTLAGGVDGVYSTRPAEEPTATMVLVHERLAQAAAAHVVAADSADPEAARLFTEVSLSATPASDPEGFVAQVQLLHLRLFGVRVAADGPEVEANTALWWELYAAESTPSAAWRDLLATLLRDPAFLLY